MPCMLSLLTQLVRHKASQEPRRAEHSDGLVIDRAPSACSILAQMFPVAASSLGERLKNALRSCHGRHRSKRVCKHSGEPPAPGALFAGGCASGVTIGMQSPTFCILRRPHRHEAARRRGARPRRRAAPPHNRRAPPPLPSQCLGVLRMNCTMP